MGIVTLLSSYGYLILFLGVVVEGEIFPLAAGFLTSTQVMDLFPAIAITFVGSFLGDLLWFGAARKWGRRLVERWGRILFLSKNRLAWLEDHFARNGKKTLFVTKFIYSFGHSSLIVAGIARMNWRDLIRVDLPASFLWACLFVFLGRVFGSSFYLLRDILKDVALTAAVIAAIAIVLQLVGHRILVRKV